MYPRTRKCRGQKGSNIAEFGPALFVLLIMMFFPLLDFLGMAADYCLAAYCNYAMNRELACRTVADGIGGAVPASGTTSPFPLTEATGKPVYNDIITNGVATTGFGQFLGLSPSTCDVQAGYTNPSDGSQPSVTSQTSVTTQPFVSVPWFSPIPGLNAPFKITISSSRPREVLQ